jgi:hypothetical protein
MQFMMFGAIRLVAPAGQGFFTAAIYQNLAGITPAGTGASATVSMISTKSMNPSTEPDVSIAVGPQLVNVPAGMNHYHPVAQLVSGAAATAYYGWLMAIPAVA